MRKFVVLAGTLLLAACLAVTAFASTRTFKVGDRYFVKHGRPQTVSISKGTTVRWRWVGSEDHNVTVLRGPRHFHSPDKHSGTYKHVFRTRGTYVLICTIHGGNQKMTIKVR